MHIILKFPFRNEAKEKINTQHKNQEYIVDRVSWKEIKNCDWNSKPPSHRRKLFTLITHIIRTPGRKLFVSAYQHLNFSYGKFFIATVESSGRFPYFWRLWIEMMIWGLHQILKKFWIVPYFLPRSILNLIWSLSSSLTPSAKMQLDLTYTQNLRNFK